MVFEINFCSEFLDIPDKTGRKTRRRRTQAITKRYAFHANAIKQKLFSVQKLTCVTAIADKKIISAFCESEVLYTTPRSTIQIK